MTQKPCCAESAEVKAKKPTLKEIIDEAEGLGCPVRKCLVLIEEFLEGPMCGRCLPCALGSYEARVRLLSLSSGRGQEEDLLALKRIASTMKAASMCKKGRDVAEFLIRCLESPASEKHLYGECPDRVCRDFLTYIVVGEKCDMCGLCKDVCDAQAIYGEKREKMFSGYLPFEIKQKKCTRCGKCVDVCPTGAIIVVMAKDKDKELINSRR